MRACLPVARAGAPPKGACARIERAAGFALDAFDCSALRLVPSAGTALARPSRLTLPRRCRFKQLSAKEQEQVRPPEYSRVPPSAVVRRPHRIGGALTLHLPCGRVRSAPPDGAASAV
jgi:hypothetical protein